MKNKTITKQFRSMKNETVKKINLIKNIYKLENSSAAIDLCITYFLENKKVEMNNLIKEELEKLRKVI